MFNLLRLLQNETMDTFSTRERIESKHKFAGTNVCKAEEDKRILYKS